MSPHYSAYFTVCTFLVATILLATQCKGDDVKTWDFDVMPGGQKWTYSESFNGATCEFAYTCQGGTKETWQMSISKVDSGEYICEVERHGPPESVSYLFFQEFSVKVDGKKLASGILFGESKIKPAHSVEYSVDHEANQMTNTPSFQSHMNKVIVTMHKDKEEL